MNNLYVYNAFCVWYTNLYRVFCMSAYFEYYKVFYYVSKYHSITLAAEKLSLTQPSVTRAIQNLEQQLGCRLFVRSRKGVELTGDGELIYKRVCTACELLFSAEEDISQAKSMNSGLVKLGIDDIMARRGFLAPAVEEFHEKYPNVSLRIFERDLSSLESAIVGDALDFCILSGAPALPSSGKSVTVRPLGDYPDAIIAGRKFSELARHELTPNELSELPFIASLPGSAARACSDELFSRLQIAPSPFIETASVDFQLHLASLGLGFCIVPFSCARERVRSGELYAIKVLGVGLEREIMLMTSASRPMSFASGKFLDILQRHINRSE